MATTHDRAEAPDLDGIRRLARPLTSGQDLSPLVDAVGAAASSASARPPTEPTSSTGGGPN